MECKHVIELLSEYIDKTCNEATCRVLAEHLATCENCNGEYLAEKAIKETCTDFGNEELPDGFQAALMDIIRKEATVAQEKVIPFPRKMLNTNILKMSGAAAIVVVLAVGIFVSMNWPGLRRPSTQDHTTGNVAERVSETEKSGTNDFTTDKQENTQTEAIPSQAVSESIHSNIQETDTTIDSNSVSPTVYPTTSVVSSMPVIDPVSADAPVTMNSVEPVSTNVPELITEPVAAPVSPATTVRQSPSVAPRTTIGTSANVSTQPTPENEPVTGEQNETIVTLETDHDVLTEPSQTVDPVDVGFSIGILSLEDPDLPLGEADFSTDVEAWNDQGQVSNGEGISILTEEVQTDNAGEISENKTNESLFNPCNDEIITTQTETAVPDSRSPRILPSTQDMQGQTGGSHPTEPGVHVETASFQDDKERLGEYKDAFQKVAQDHDGEIVLLRCDEIVTIWSIKIESASLPSVIKDIRKVLRHNRVALQYQTTTDEQDNSNIPDKTTLELSFSYTTT